MLLAKRHLKCPQCGRYPREESTLGTAYPFTTVWQLRDGLCFHCGTSLPLET